MEDSTARVIGSVGVWASFAVVMAFGVCRMNFTGDFSNFAFMVVVGMVCLSSVIATGLIWRGRAGSTTAKPVGENE